MITTIQELIESSGDAYLKELKYEKGEAIFVLVLDEADITVEVRLKTTLFSVDIPNSQAIPSRTCFLELTSLSEVLKSQNGIFIPSSSFGSFMNEKRRNLNLAYGLKSSEYNYILSLSASKKLASFVLKDLQEVRFLTL